MTTFYTRVFILRVAVFFAACDGKAVDTHKTISILDEKKVEFLLDSAVSDFRLTSKQLPANFRNVYFGQIFHKNGVTQNILCGEFFASIVDSSGIWTNFSTVQTGNYEQWLGASSGQFYKHVEARIHTDNDLTSEIKQRLK